MENTSYADLIRQHLILNLVSINEKAPKLDFASVLYPLPGTRVFQ